MTKTKILFPTLILFAVIFTIAPSNNAISQDKISEASLERATREVDKEVIPENFEWVSREKVQIKKEDGELLKDPSGENDTAFSKPAAEDLPPCAPCKLPSPRKR